ncbi:VCBS repeat-containing protein [Streptomyces sp. NBC_00094]|uniref:FG-GAP repeat domain-containing protein n=1 Tax=Streptomyces sp. NBC_00094 TaxID=2903620 RepID=UPI00224D339B|nr:VCBS repeat-containing protein [Streptomyces sp. NBC_00094]MCX5392449.1 VCBS repeat-containing protein [Streptomyces sp. NBC_00094]
MSPSPTARRRLAAAVITALAVTASTAGTAVPATAAPAATGAVPATPAAAPLPVPKLPAKTEVVSSGPNGFLGSIEHVDSENNSGFEYRWFRPDGTSALITEAFSYGSSTLPNALVSDIVATADTGSRVVRLRDMSTPASAGADPVVIDLRTLGSTHYARALYGSTVLAVVTPASGPMELHLVSKSGTGLSDRKITGLPADIESVAWAKGTPGTAFISYKTKGVDASRAGLAVIDLASAAVTETYAPPAESGPESRPADVSPTEVVRWVGDKLFVTDRATGATTPVTVGFSVSKVLGLLGDRVAYSRSTDTGGGTAGDPLLPLTLRSLTDGRTVTLLDRASSLVHAPDGTLLVRGGTAEKGEGVYRIALGADGEPTAELVATTGESTALTLDSTNVGPVVDLDLQNNRAYLSWDLSHDNFSYTVELIHKESRRRYVHSLSNQGAGNFRFLWRGNFAQGETDPGKAAFNGDYTWKLTAKPHNGIGEDLHATGDFKVARKPKIHDFDNNGSPDLLFRDHRGILKRIDTMYDAWKGKVVPVEDPQWVGEGWNGYKLIESVGDIAGTTAPDVVGRDAAGVLWLHQGTGSESSVLLASRVRIGAGWNIYTQLAAGSDVTGDGRADVLATDTAGVMWLYKGTGNATAPLANRTKVGAGWNIYNQISAVGNVAGAAAGDFVARDKAGVLWLYLGNGNGTFASRIRVGGGWNQYSQIVGIGDATMDGRADLYAYGPNNTSYIYPGTGSWRTPFQTRVPTDVLVDNGDYGINHVT